MKEKGKPETRDSESSEEAPEAELTEKEKADNRAASWSADLRNPRFEAGPDHTLSADLTDDE